MYDPDAKENVNGDMIHKYIPTSPRNRLVYFLVVGHVQLRTLIKYLQTCDSQTHTHGLQEDIADEIELFPPAPKKCKQGPRIVSVTARSIVEEVGADKCYWKLCVVSKKVYKVFVFCLKYTLNK